VGLLETKNQQGRKFGETCWVRIFIRKKKTKKSNNEKVATSRKKVRLVIDNEK